MVIIIFIFKDYGGLALVDDVVSHNSSITFNILSIGSNWGVSFFLSVSLLLLLV
jgi:hypothetical protein